MQSVTKTVTSVIVGAAIEHGDFKASLDTPVLKYFDASKVKNLDDRKQRMTLRHLLTMSSGFEWNADGFDTGDPKNDTSLMEASDDWVQYAIDKRMVAEPGKVWNYNDGATELLAYIFQKETGQDIDDYAQTYVFAPLGIRHEWKRTYLGVVDTEGGLYLTGSDLAKVGYLYLQDGMWSADRVQRMGERICDTLLSNHGRPRLQGWSQIRVQVVALQASRFLGVCLDGRGFGGQHLEVFPQEELIVILTAWDFLPTSTAVDPSPPVFLPLAKTKTCPRTR